MPGLLQLGCHQTRAGLAGNAQARFGHQSAEGEDGATEGSRRGVKGLHHASDGFGVNRYSRAKNSKHSPRLRAGAATNTRGAEPAAAVVSRPTKVIETRPVRAPEPAVVGTRLKGTKVREPRPTDEAGAGAGQK